MIDLDYVVAVDIKAAGERWRAPPSTHTARQSAGGDGWRST